MLYALLYATATLRFACRIPIRSNTRLGYTTRNTTKPIRIRTRYVIRFDPTRRHDTTRLDHDSTHQPTDLDPIRHQRVRNRPDSSTRHRPDRSTLDTAQHQIITFVRHYIITNVRLGTTRHDTTRHLNTTRLGTCTRLC